MRSNLTAGDTVQLSITDRKKNSDRKYLPGGALPPRQMLTPWVAHFDIQPKLYPHESWQVYCVCNAKKKNKKQKQTTIIF